jgi:Big-like domain-containing protein
MPDPAPTVTDRSPAEGAVDVPVTENPTATFDIPMDPYSMKTSSVQVVKPSGSLQPLVPRYDPATKKLTFDIVNVLNPLTLYRVRITTAVKSTQGVPLSAEESWSFTTGTT